MNFINCDACYFDAIYYYIINALQFNALTRFNFGNVIVNISLCKWKSDATSPVIFMIDDLANIYFERPGQFNAGDWGGCRDKEGSLYHFLNTEILSAFPEVKFTFFLVTGIREVQSVGTYDYVNSCDHPAFLSFLTRLENEGHEIAYHGMEHGVLDENNNFIQEWAAFPDLASAVDKIKKGMDLVEGAHIKVSGGKYCGYEVGKFGHESIVKYGFDWWFDTWDVDVSKRPDGEFRANVFYMPSNIDCSMYAPHLLSYLGKMKYYRSVFKQLKEGAIGSKIDKLLGLKAIISLQEHTSPIRTDGKIQYPNVFDDLNSISYILSKLRAHHVWWATASQVTNYSRNREFLEIHTLSGKCFTFRSTHWSQCKIGEVVTIAVASNVSCIKNAGEKFLVYKKESKSLVDVIVQQNSVYNLMFEDSCND